MADTPVRIKGGRIPLARICARRAILLVAMKRFCSVRMGAGAVMAIVGFLHGKGRIFELC